MNKQDFKNLRKLNDLEVKEIVDKTMIETISTLDINLINNIFRNGNITLQEKLWEHDIIRKVLIIGTKEDYIYNPKTIRNLENLGKVIKSEKIKEEIYKDEYFLTVAMYVRDNENRFFSMYDIKKIATNLFKSNVFNNLPKDKQYKLLYNLNDNAGTVLLPDDFRERYSNIETILLNSRHNDFPIELINKLTDNEILLLEITKPDFNDSKVLKKIILDYINNKSFDELNKYIDELEITTRKRMEKLQKRHYSIYLYLDKKVYDIILNDLVKDEIILEKFLKYLITSINIPNTNVNLEQLYNNLKRSIYYNEFKFEDIGKLIHEYDDVETKEKRIIFYLKFNKILGSVRYLYGISLEQLKKINVKHINKIYNLLKDNTQDELSAIYGVAIKMYLIFGYERTLEILNNKYGEYNKTFLDNVGKTDVTKINMKEEGSKYLPVIDKRFINFMFETPTNNHFINMLNNKRSEIYKRWYYLYNNYDEILEKCHNEITLKKVSEILETEKFDFDKNIIKPNNYELLNNDFLENIVLGNKTHYPNETVLKKINEIYTEMKKRVESSIPYTKGISTNNYKYEIMKLDDYILFELGYKANCCIRTLDIAHNHLLYTALCRNGRVLLLYDKLGDLIAFCPLKRNGNVLIINSVETIDKNISKYNDIKICLKEAIENIVSITNNEKEPIDLVCIGRESYIKPDYVPFPNDYLTPTIYEKHIDVYKDTDRYHKKLDIIYKRDNFDIKNIKNKDPEVSYMDPREEIKYVDFTDYKDHDDILDLINSINYALYQDSYIRIYRFSIKKVYYNKDWYIIEKHDGTIYGEYLENDYRGKEEYESTLNKLIKQDNKTLKKIQ